MKTSITILEVILGISISIIIAIPAIIVIGVVDLVEWVRKICNKKR